MSASRPGERGDAAAWFSPSLNQAVIARLPGLPPAIAGTRAVEWLSTPGIARRMAARGLRGGLPPLTAGSGTAAGPAAPLYPRRLDDLVADARPDALALADELGVALAALVATLVLGPADARVARPEWPAAHWARWARVRHVLLGGGLVSGHLGRQLLTAARPSLTAFGVGHVILELAPDPQALVLHGIAAGVPDGPAVLLDAGHTTVKRAQADIADGRAARFRLAEPVATSTLLELRGVLLADRLADMAMDVVAAAALGKSFGSLGLAMALYTDASGQPRPGQSSAFASLAGIPLRAHLRERLAARVGRPVAVHTSGDGAAAAAAVRGVADAAIMLGTAIGSGLNT